MAGKPAADADRHTSDRHTQSQRFWDAWRELDKLYERYARSQGLSYTSLCVLDEIWRAQASGEALTQKVIGERTFLPKQTVNSIVGAFLRNGLVELAELPQDRRAKVVRLTEPGRRFAERVIVPEGEAEDEAFSEFSESEREQLLALLGRFVAACRGRLEARSS